MTTTSPTTHRTAEASTLAAGTAATLVGAAGTVFGAHTWIEIAVTVTGLAILAGVVFGYVVPRALRKPSAGGTALALSIPAVLLTLPAFWTGLPLVLGVAGAMVGYAGRNARSGSVQCTVALVLGALAVLGYLAIYIVDIVTGNGGFLFE